jgi:hypothetical protein
MAVEGCRFSPNESGATEEREEGTQNAGTALQCRSPEVIQGYNGIATVDEKHQVIVDAAALARATRRSTFQHEHLNIHGEVALTTDSQFRKRDPRFGMRLFARVVLPIWRGPVT